MFKNVEFQDLVYTVDEQRHIIGSRRKRCLLRGVNGVFQQGKLTAIMGPSGAGKSSLLNAISGYRTSGVSGTIKINRKKSCYITQDDVHHPLLTVEELMEFACELKVMERDAKGKEQIITDILTSLNLNRRRKNTSKQLSGGERKRLSIAMELVSNPSVFFLDEPTSGLDEVTASQCIRLLKVLARESRTVVCTIHQPSSAVLQLFDHVFVLAKGQCVFQGTPDSLVPYLSSVDLKCPTHYNPADYIIELCDADRHVITSLSELIQNGKLGATTFYDQTNGTNAVNLSVLATSMHLLDRPPPPPISVSSSIWEKMKSLRRYVFESDYAKSSFKQFTVLMKMMNKKIYRNKVALNIQLVHHILCGVLFGLIFYKAADDGFRMFDHLKYCIGVVFFLSYTQVIVPILSYPQEVKLVKKECFNKWYSLGPYYLALTLSRIPMQFFFNVLFLTLSYWLPGLPLEWWRFMLFSMVGMIVSLVAEGLGLAIGATFSVTNGCAAGPLFLAPLLGLAIYGFDFAADISMMMYGLMKLSFIRGGVVSLVLVVFGYNRRQLQCNEMYCHFDDPQVLLRYLRVDNVNLWTELGFLIGLMILFRFLLYLSLRNRTK